MGFRVKNKFRLSLGTDVIAVYSGKGASHSWIWFAELFEKYGLYPNFIDENSLRIQRGASILIVPGGDPVTLARSVGKDGLKSVKRFIHRGGRYIGSCAGAYLPLRTSLSPLSYFNLVNLRVRNIGEKKNEDVKSYTPYGDRCIIHPFRGDVAIRLNGQIMNSPVFGGPVFEKSDEVDVLGVYEGITDNTILFMDREKVMELISGYPAVVQAEKGKGKLLLLGPHLEYPDCKSGNEWLVSWIGRPDYTFPDYDKVSRESFLRFREICSDLLVVSGSFIGLPSVWRIGVKAWEPEKLQYFAIAIWKRIKKMDNCRFSVYSFDEIHLSIERVIQRAKEIKQNIKAGKDTTELASEMFDEILSATRKFMENYFLWKMMGDECKKS